MCITCFGVDAIQRQSKDQYIFRFSGATIMAWGFHSTGILSSADERVGGYDWSSAVGDQPRFGAL